MLSIIFAITIPDIWDYRVILPLFLLALTLYLMAQIAWKDVKRIWMFIAFLCFLLWA